jgi:DNA-binding NarL/FixJ family response regulator
MMYFGESVKAVERISVLVHADDPVARGDPGADHRGVQKADRGAGDLPADLLGGLLDQVGRARRCGAAPAGLITSGLSERETDVIRLVAEGLDTREIASKLCYSERTIKNVLHGLMSRLQLRNRAHAVAFAAREGYL